MSCKRSYLGMRSRVPELKRAVRASRGYAITIRREGAMRHPSLVPFKGAEQRSRDAIPHLDGLVRRARNNSGGIEREGATPNDTLVPLQSGQSLSAYQIPKLQRAIFGSGD